MEIVFIVALCALSCWFFHICDKVDDKVDDKIKSYSNKKNILDLCECSGLKMDECHSVYVGVEKCTVDELNIICQHYAGKKYNECDFTIKHGCTMWVKNVKRHDNCVRIDMEDKHDWNVIKTYKDKCVVRNDTVYGNTRYKFSYLEHSLSAYDNNLRQKVCLKCGECVDEFQDALIYIQNEIDEEHKREELSKKLWEECDKYEN